MIAKVLVEELRASCPHGGRRGTRRNPLRKLRMKLTANGYGIVKVQS